jgi:hypothetical protein
MLALAGPAQAATPEKGTLKPNANGKGKTAYTGQVRPGTASQNQTGTADLCFDAAGAPDPGTSGCDFYTLTLDVPDGFYKQWIGGASVHVEGPDDDLTDIDLYIYERNKDGTADFEKGAVATSTTPTATEETGIPGGRGDYFLVVTPYQTVGPADYSATVEFVTDPRVPPLELNKRVPPGFPNYRASHDKYTSHSEPTIAMDPLNPNHLLAGSKQYENNAKYLFKIGTYESFDGGRTWKDYGHLPGYCHEPGQCDPADEEHYRTTSDITIAFDDEGNAYGNVLDAPGGTFAFKGFNMTAHIKKPGKPWSEPIIVHDNRNNPITAQALLDDKNWIAVDNHTDVDGGENKPNDGKIGTIYICWSLDDTTTSRGQQIVMMRSLDGGLTWGGVAPGDNTPMSVSNRPVIAGIGCHILIDQDGSVIVTWYDNLAGALMQTRSSDHGASFEPARPIVLIEGNDAPFPGQTFRNLSIPTTGIDKEGNIYVAVSARNNLGGNAPFPVRVQHAAEELIENGEFDRGTLKELMFEAGEIPESALEGGGEGEEEEEGGEFGEREELADGEKKKCPDEADELPCSDILLFKSTNGGLTYEPPVRVNQDPKESPADQFQPWLAVTPKGQIDVMYFDRRNDPANFYIDTYLARSDDKGAHFYDTRVSALMWDPEVNPPTSVSGAFIGDYQGLVADDQVAIPFWNDTQLAAYPKDDPRYSPWQEVFAARVPNTVVSRIGKPRNGKRVRRGRSQMLRGRASPLGGQKVTKVQVAVARRVGKRCKWYTGKRYTKKRSCKKPRWVNARGTKRWRYKLKRRALRKRGRYLVRSRASAGKLSETIFEPRRNQIRFRVKKARVRRSAG